MPCVVVRKVGKLPVYAVKPVDGGRERVLHRNLLLPYRLPKSSPPPKQKKIPYLRQRPAAAECESDVVTEESEIEEEFIPRSTTPVNGTPLDPTMPSFVMSEILPVTDEPAPANDLPETERAIEAELHETQQEEVNVDENQSVTRSGRISKPPERLGVQPVWSNTVAVLLSLVNDNNRSNVENVLGAWLSMPSQRQTVV